MPHQTDLHWRHDLELHYLQHRYLLTAVFCLERCPRLHWVLVFTSGEHAQFDRLLPAAMPSVLLLSMQPQSTIYDLPYLGKKECDVKLRQQRRLHEVHIGKEIEL